MAEIENYKFFNPRKLGNLNAQQTENFIKCTGISSDLLTCPIETQRLFVLEMMSKNKIWSILKNKTFSSYWDSLVKEISTKTTKSLPRHVSVFVRNQTKEDGVFLMVDHLELGYEMCACRHSLKDVKEFFISSQLNITRGKLGFFSRKKDHFETIRISSSYDLKKPKSLQFDAIFDLKNSKSENDS